MLRRFCDRDLHISDTISARLAPENGVVSGNVRWPNEFIVILRRAAPRPEGQGPQLLFGIVSARINGAAYEKVRGTFMVEPESADSGPAGPVGSCYSSALVFGRLTNELYRR